MNARLLQDLKNTNINESAHKVPPAALPPAAAPKCKKTAVSLFQTDLEKIKAIRDFMQAHGHFVNTSQAIKLALRLVPLSPALLEAVAELKADDGRISKV